MQPTQHFLREHLQLHLVFCVQVRGTMRFLQEAHQHRLNHLNCWGWYALSSSYYKLQLIQSPSKTYNNKRTCLHLITTTMPLLSFMKFHIPEVSTAKTGENYSPIPTRISSSLVTKWQLLDFQTNCR